MSARQPRDDTPPPVTELARLRLASGLDAGGLDDLGPRARRAVEVATRAGADVTASLDAAGAAEADARQAQRAIDVACAQTRTVAAGLLVAPPLLVPALGRLLGADLVGFYAQPLGWAVGAVVLLLLAAGAGGVWALLARARRSLHTPARQAARSRPCSRPWRPAGCWRGGSRRWPGGSSPDAGVRCPRRSRPTRSPT
jgi:hypothetical protein